MKLLNQILHLDKVIEELDNSALDSTHQAWLYRQQRHKLMAELILQKDLLSGSTWNVELINPGLTNFSSINLNYTGKISDPSPMKEILDLARVSNFTSGTSSLQLMDGINIRFDDNHISLSFKESKMLLPFVQKYGLIINGSTIQDSLSKLKRDVAALELVCHQLKL